MAEGRHPRNLLHLVEDDRPLEIDERAGEQLFPQECQPGSESEREIGLQKVVVQAAWKCIPEKRRCADLSRPPEEG